MRRAEAPIVSTLSAMRIVSLVPAGTEMVAALGCASSLVAVTHDCDFPPEVRTLPRVTRTTIPAGASSRAIDAAVRDAASRGETTFHLDAAALRDARPDVIVGQTLCAVCAVTFDALPVSLRERIVPLAAETIDGMFADVARVTGALDVATRGTRLVATLRSRMEAVRTAVEGRPRPRVACLEWLDPMFNGGHWVPEQVAFAGGDDVLGRSGQRSREVSVDELHATDPDALILMPCGFHEPRAAVEADAFVARRDVARLRAVRERRVHVVDGAAHFSRPGPRLIDGVEVLAALLHPERDARASGSSRRLAAYTPRAN